MHKCITILFSESPLLFPTLFFNGKLCNNNNNSVYHRSKSSENQHYCRARRYAISVCVLLLARCSCAVQVVAGNKLYVAGGLARGAALDTLQVFDGDTWTWSLEQVSSSSSRARLG